MDFILPQRRRSRLWIHAGVLVAALSVAASLVVAQSKSANAQAPDPGASPSPAAEPLQLVSPPPADPPPPPPPPPEPSYPALPTDSGSGRRIVYSNSGQRVWLVEDGGEITGSWLVSGRRGVPRVGVYRVFSRSRHTTARGGRVRMEYMVRFARGRRLAIGFHSIPVDRRGRQIQTVAQLGTYRSAGCVRMSYEDAARMWNWAPAGTAVFVTR